MSTAYQVLRDVMGELRLLAPGEEPPVLTEAHRDAQTEAMKAFQDYVPVRDPYWATRWGREGNPPKSRLHRLGWRAHNTWRRAHEAGNH